MQQQMDTRATVLSIPDGHIVRQTFFPHLLLDDIMNHLTLDLSAAVGHKIQEGWMKAPY